MKLAKATELWLCREYNRNRPWRVSTNDPRIARAVHQGGYADVLLRPTMVGILRCGKMLPPQLNLVMEIKCCAVVQERRCAPDGGHAEHRLGQRGLQHELHEFVGQQGEDGDGRGQSSSSSVEAKQYKRPDMNENLELRLKRLRRNEVELDGEVERRHGDGTGECARASRPGWTRWKPGTLSLEGVSKWFIFRPSSI